MRKSFPILLGFSFHLALVLMMANTTLAQDDYDAGSRGGVGSGLYTQYDLTGRYEAEVAEAVHRADLFFWGTAAKLNIRMQNRPKPFVGAFKNGKLKVLADYGGRQNGLQEYVEAIWNGKEFVGIYLEGDRVAGARKLPIIIRPPERGGGGGEELPPLTVPRKKEDIPGLYQLEIDWGPKKQYLEFKMRADEGEILFDIADKDFSSAYSPNELNPLHWGEKDESAFRLDPTSFGFEGKYIKTKGSAKPKQFPVKMTKIIEVDGDDGCGDDEHWTYVYVVVRPGVPPMIGKLMLHGENKDGENASFIMGPKPDKTQQLDGTYKDGKLFLHGQGVGVQRYILKAEGQAGGGFKGFYGVDTPRFGTQGQGISLIRINQVPMAGGKSLD